MIDAEIFSTYLIRKNIYSSQQLMVPNPLCDPICESGVGPFCKLCCHHEKGTKIF